MSRAKLNSLRMGEGWKEKDLGVIFTLYGDKEEKESEVQNKSEEKIEGPLLPEWEVFGDPFWMCR
jgi:hypothetical protein